MPNRNLMKEELNLANVLLAELRSKLIALSGGDKALLFAYRRKVAKELTYDERGKPMHRKLLKLKKMIEQSNKCAICSKPLPEKYAVLDRLDGMAEYTVVNTRLIHSECDAATQLEGKYS